jgi:general secretion pathway protein H
MILCIEMPRMQKSSTGYTLLELLIVLAILGLIATLAAPAANRMVEAATLRSDARKLASDLSGLQQLVAEKNLTISIADDSNRQGLHVEGAPSFILSRDETLEIAPGTRKLVYYPDGTSSGGAIEVVEPHGRMTAEIAWLTGAVNIVSRQ